MRIALLLGLLVLALPAPSMACSCGYVSPRRALAGADVVFAGTVEEVIQVDRSERLEERIIVRFTVGRIWKGDVGAQFTLHTFHGSPMCIGLENAEVGEELLVFAFAEEGEHWKSSLAPSTPEEAKRLSGAGSERELLRQDLVDALPGGVTIYTTSVCSGTRPWSEAGSLASALGSYRAPEDGHSMRDAPDLDSRRDARLGRLSFLCRDLVRELGEIEVVEPPVNSAELEELLAKNEHYVHVSPTPIEYVDLWLREDRDSLALCRAPKADAEECGGVTAAFRLQREARGGKWALVGLVTDPCYME